MNLDTPLSCGLTLEVTSVTHNRLSKCFLVVNSSVFQNLTYFFYLQMMEVRYVTAPFDSKVKHDLRMASFT